MRRIFLTLTALILVMLGIAVVGVIVIMATPMRTGSEEELFQPIHAVGFFPDGLRFATMNNAGPVRIWDVKTGKELKRFTPNGRDHRYAGFLAMALSGDGSYLAGASNRDCNGKSIGGPCVQVWDVATEQVVARFSGHSEVVKAVGFTTDGRSVLSAGGDRTIRVWDIATGREIRCLSGHASDINTLAVTPDRRHVISGAGDYHGGHLHDPTIRMWDIETGAMIRVFEGHDGKIDDLSVSPDGKLLASVSWDCSLKLWELSSGKLLRTTLAPRGGFNAVTFSPSGKTLLTCSSYEEEGSVQLWDAASGQRMREFGLKTIARGAAFSPDGEMLVTAQVITVPAPPPHPLALMSFDERWAGIAVVWDFASGKELLRVGEVPRRPTK